MKKIQSYMDLDKNSKNLHEQYTREGDKLNENTQSP
jgi:hypothetical protein